MPDTLMLAFQRPSDEELAAMRLALTRPVSGYVKSDEVSKEVWHSLIEKHLMNSDGPYMFLNWFGRLVLAACDADTPDPVGKVVEADRIAVYLTRGEISLAYSLAVQNENMWDACSDDPIPDTATSLVQALARATGKVGEVG